MLKRTVVRSAVAATAILLGLAVQATAQTAQPPAGEAYQNQWNDHYYDNDRYYDNGWNGRTYDRTYSDEGYYGRPYYGPGYRDAYYGGGYYYGGPVEAGVDIAGGVVRGAGEIVGGTVGAVVGGPPAAYAQADQSYCMQRFRSFDPASGTYLGYDGRRHPCP